jgi:ribosomal protein L14E/L6E/L27E
MGRIFKQGRVVILTAGRFAGKKAIVAKNYEEGTKKLRFPHLTVLGIARNPRTVKRNINKKKFIKKTGVKTFIKSINQNHVIPTRFVVNDFDLKDIKEDNIKTLEARHTLTRQFRKTLSEQYRNLPDIKTNDKAGNIKFFYSRLRF